MLSNKSKRNKYIYTLHYFSILNVITELCRTDIDWAKLPDHLRVFNMRVFPIVGDGYCYIRSIIKVLETDYHRKLNISDVIELVEEQLLERLDYYSQWHAASKREVVADAQKFLRGRNYTLDVVDVVVAATADALGIQLKLFSRVGTKVHILSHTSPNHARYSVYLRYTGNHYDAVIDTSTMQPPPPLGIDEAEVPDTQADLEDFSLPTAHSTEISHNRDNKKRVRRPLFHVSEMQCDDDLQFDDPSEDYIINDEDMADFDINKHENIRPKDDKEVIRQKVQNAITGRVKPGRNKKNHLNTWKFQRMDPCDVEEVPYRITGTHVLRLDVEDKDKMMTRAQDGRWWRFSDSTKKGFTGVRKFGTCMGSRACPNISCLKVVGDGIVNNSDFKKKGKDEYLCQHCGHYAVQVYCGCFKVLEYHPDNNNMVIFHEGEHICNPKPDVEKNKRFFEKNAGKTLGRTPEETATNMILYALCTGKVDEAEEAAEMTINKGAVQDFHRNKVVQGQQYLTEPEDKGFARLVKVREDLRTVDPFRLYAMNSREINGKSSFVFKSSRQAADLMVSMDIDISTHTVMTQEFAYFDAMHSRCKNYRTLTLWTYHPAMRKLQCLAIMECEHENTENIILFFNTLNAMLREHTGDPSYKFNPCGIIVDEGGANWKAIRDVFGCDSKTRVVGCQWHFLNCARRQLTHIKPDERKSFEMHYRDLVKAHTDKEYKRVFKAMYSILRRAGRTTWLLWWDIRKYHIVPCFRGYDMPSLNLAETGHAKLQRMGKNLRFSVASLRDIAMFMKQKAEYAAYLRGEKTNIGRGPTQIEIERRQARKDDKMVSDFLDVVRDEDFMGEFEDDADVFMPTDKARHRFRGKEKNPLEQDREEGNKKKRNQSNKKRNKVCNEGLFEQLKYPQVWFFTYHITFLITVTHFIQHF